MDRVRTGGVSCVRKRAGGFASLSLLRNATPLRRTKTTLATVPSLPFFSHPRGGVGESGQRLPHKNADVVTTATRRRHDRTTKAASHLPHVCRRGSTPQRSPGTVYSFDPIQKSSVRSHRTIEYRETRRTMEYPKFLQYDGVL